MTKRQTQRLHSLLPNGKPRWIRAYDNGGESADRYTVIFTGRYTHKTQGEHFLLAMSAYPYHPQGVGLHCSYPYQVDCRKGRKYCWPPAVGRKCHLGRRITFDDLPKDCQALVLADYKELWDLTSSKG